MKIQNFIKTSLLVVFILAQLSCNREDEYPTTAPKPKNTKHQLPTTQTQDDVIDSTSINLFSAKLTALYEEIADLEQSAFCRLQNICKNDTLDQEERLELIENDSTLDSVYQNLLLVNDFMGSNSTLISDIYTDESAENLYFASKFASDLGIAYEAPNYDPCSSYWAARKSCALSYITGVILATESGPLAPFAWALLTAVYIDCLNNTDLAYPNCVSSGSSQSTISRIIANQSECE